MNKTRIDWADYSWNPIVGCLHECPYCYARDVAHRFPKAFPNAFEPTFHPDRLDEPLKVEQKADLFVGSMTDMFGCWVPDLWIERVFQAMADAPWHNYTILTKAPENLKGWWPGKLPYVPHLNIGTSITGNLDDTDEVERICAMDAHVPHDASSVVSLEPYLTRMEPERLERLMVYPLGWLIIGGMTGRKKFKPPVEWIMPLVEWAREKCVPVFVKRNAGYPHVVQEYPSRMMEAVSGDE